MESEGCSVAWSPSGVESVVRSWQLYGFYNVWRWQHVESELCSQNIALFNSWVDKAVHNSPNQQTNNQCYPCLVHQTTLDWDVCTLLGLFITSENCATKFTNRQKCVTQINKVFWNNLSFDHDIVFCNTTNLSSTLDKVFWSRLVFWRCFSRETSHPHTRRSAHWHGPW